MAKKGAGQKHRHTQRQKQQQWEAAMDAKKRQSARVGAEPNKETPPWWERDVSGKKK